MEAPLLLQIFRPRSRIFRSFSSASIGVAAMPAAELCSSVGVSSIAADEFT
jgi:hypothetical protein